MHTVRALARWAPPIAVAIVMALVLARTTLDDGTFEDDCPPAAPLPLPPVDLASATAEELERLPRIGPMLAARIVASRRAHGPFRTIDDLARVDGIGAATVERLRGLVVTGIDASAGSAVPADAGAWQRE